jgi:hypothetical protein
VSPELQGALVGGGMVLLTAVVGHVFAWLQLKSNRAFELRQAVYLEAAEVLANSLRFFDDVANLNVEDGHLTKDIHPVSVTMFKIHVVGTPATMAALSAANHFLTSASGDLAKKRAELRVAVDKASQSEDPVTRAEVERRRGELFQAALQASMLYQRHLGEMNVAIRRELGLKLDGGDYRETNLKAEERIMTAIENIRSQGPSQTAGS